MKYYHVTQKKNLESILKNGLFKKDQNSSFTEGIYLFDLNEDSSIDIHEAARILAGSLRTGKSEESEDLWCLLEIDSEGINEVEKDPSILSAELFGYSSEMLGFKWNQYLVNMEVISPKYIKFVEDFKVNKIRFYERDGFDYMGVFDFMFAQSYLHIQQCIDDGTLEFVLKRDINGSVKKEVLNVRNQIAKQFPNDPVLVKMIEKIDHILKKPY